MKQVAFLFTIFLYASSTYAADGRDRALPDQYECKGCGGWERYRQDQAAQKQQADQNSGWQQDRQEDQLREERRKNDLLEEQNKRLRDRSEDSYYDRYERYGR
jgi:hypothetical protein